MESATALGTDKSVTIGVCTFQRLELFNALASFEGLRDAKGYDLRVLVVDNDETDDLRSRVKEFASEYPFPLRYVHAPAKNISIARNAVLDAVETPWLLFIDDDEVADPGWLSAMMADAASHDAIIGACEAVYDPVMPAWLEACDFHSNRITGRVENAYTSNALLRMTFVREHSLRFRVELGRTGGEDTVFFHELARAGGRMAYCPNAIVLEPVSHGRASMDWVKTRQYRAGQTHGLITREFAPAAYRTLLLTAGAKAFFSAVMSLLTIPGSNASRKWWARAYLHAGAARYRLSPKILEEYA
ncbi:MAG: glycosyltransferase family 2 protein [Erythrobacter sp.]|nr:glycosyltransferase family 2 protein [Erythrobacter sp.]